MKSKNIPIYNIGNFQKSNGEKNFYANTAIEHLEIFKCIIEPHKHDHFLTFLCTKGKGTHEVDFIKHPVKPGSIFMLSPGQTHKLTLSSDVDGYVIMHTRDFYDLNYTNKRVREYPFYCTSLDSPGIELKNENYDYVLKIFKEIIHENRNEALMKNHVLCSLIDILYIRLSRLYLPNKNINPVKQNYLIYLMKLDDLIEANFKDKKSPSDYSKMMNMSIKHLNRICKVCVNKTTSDIIMDKIILEAKRMLVYGIFSIDQVATELGYFDQSYFTRLFKKKTGTTPIQFMKKYRSDTKF